MRCHQEINSHACLQNGAPVLHCGNHTNCFLRRASIESLSGKRLKDGEQHLKPPAKGTPMDHMTEDAILIDFVGGNRYLAEF